MTKGNKIILALIILVSAVACGLFLWQDARGTDGAKMMPLVVTVFKVGKADAIVLQNGEKTMVIDAGEEEDGEEIAAFLDGQGIKCVDTLIITHFDRDHVGGADVLAEAIEIKEVVLPKYVGTSTEYLDFMAVLKQKNIEPKELENPLEFAFGEAKMLVEPPKDYKIPANEAEFDNNFSLITTVTHGKNKLLFTGDAEKQRIRQWLEGKTKLGCNFLKMPHHGVYNSALKELLNATSPQYAVICSSNKNPAEEKTLELLKAKNIRYFETKDGNITVISDGNKLEMSRQNEK